MYQTRHNSKSKIIVDDRKVDHLRETYIKSDSFHLIKLKSTLNIKVHWKIWFHKANKPTNHCKTSKIFFNRKFQLGYENAEKMTVIFKIAH